MKVLLVLACLMACASFAQAEIGGKKVIFVHGFQPNVLNPLVGVEERKRTAREQAGSEFAKVINDYLYYNSRERLSTNASDLRGQIKVLESKGTCRNGCYFVTASTGDLVTRYVISRLGQWGVDPNKFRILMSIDTVGAGGGTEGADTIVSIVEGNPVSSTINKLLGGAFGIQLDFGAIVGIMRDLRPTVARSHATGSYNVPRLRLAAGKTTPILSQLFLRGGDDGVVPMHSACGSSRQESIYSCSRSIHDDGKLGSASGPKSFKYNNFPILMAHEMSHTDINYSGRLVALNNNRRFAGTDYSVSERTFTTGRWIFKKHYRVVNKPSNQRFTNFIINEFNN